MGSRRLDTLADLARHGIPLAVICPNCDHRSSFTPGALSLYWKQPGGKDPRRLKFRCSFCGTRTAPQIAPPR